MISNEMLGKMWMASHLLPDPGGGVVRECIDEIKRLKEGKFTEEEFQNLCHNFNEDDAKRHWEGCKEYHCKLFGKPPPV